VQNGVARRVPASTNQSDSESATFSGTRGSEARILSPRSFVESVVYAEPAVAGILPPGVKSAQGFYPCCVTRLRSDLVRLVLYCIVVALVLKRVPFSPQEFPKLRLSSSDDGA